jgi:hypothetical protein
MVVVVIILLAYCFCPDIYCDSITVSGVNLGLDSRQKTEGPMNKIIGLTMLLAGSAGLAMAGATTPEIDASSGIAAIALLSGGLLVLRSRRRKQ